MFFLKFQSIILKNKTGYWLKCIFASSWNVIIFCNVFVHAHNFHWHKHLVLFFFQNNWLICHYLKTSGFWWGFSELAGIIFVNLHVVKFIYIFHQQWSEFVAGFKVVWPFSLMLWSQTSKILKVIHIIHVKLAMFKNIDTKSMFKTQQYTISPLFNKICDNGLVIVI